MTHDKARRILATETDPILRYDAHKVLSTPEPLPPPARERKLDSSSNNFSADIQRRLRAERKCMLSVVAEALAAVNSLAKSIETARENDRREHAGELRKLRIELAGTEIILGELRRSVLAAERGPIDLPSPLRARVN